MVNVVNEVPNADVCSFRLNKVLGWNMDLVREGDQYGRTPLHFAAPIDHVHISNSRKLLIFIFRKYIVRCFKFLGWSLPIRETNGDNNKDRLTAILMDADESLAYQPDNNGSFPIHIAASEDSLDAVKIFLTKNPDCVNLRNAQGRTFLHVAVEKRRHNIVAFACREPWLAPFLNMQDYDMNTPLHLAVTVGDLKIFANLMRNQQVCLNMANNKGQTPLDISESAINHSGFHYGSVIINFTLSQTTFRLTEKNPFHCFGNYQLYSCRMHRDGYIGYLVLPAWKVV